MESCWSVNSVIFHTVLQKSFAEVLQKIFLGGKKYGSIMPPLTFATME